MGTSGSINKRISYSEYIPALLIIFTKIKEFYEYFKYQKDNNKILSIIFNSLIDNNFLDGSVVEFNKLLPQNKDDLNIKLIIVFILDKLHQENNELNTVINQAQIINNTNESETYNNFLNYYKYNKSIIQDLFYREEETISTCSKCKTIFYFFKIEKLLYFNMMKYYDIKKKDNDLNLLDLIKIHEEKTDKNDYCEKCKINNNILSITKIKKLPEIFIITFDNINYKNMIEYYLKMNFGFEKYMLIGIIINKNEKNEDIKNYNAFYKDKFSFNKWLIYDTVKKETRQVKDITKIWQNPLVCFYQKKITHIKIYMNKFYNQLNNLYNDLIFLEKKINKHIVDEKKFEKYYIINKSWFIKLTKILEEEEIFNNNMLLETFSNITNIHNLNSNQIDNKYEFILDRIKNLSDENIYQFTPEFEVNEETGIKYPKDFVIISEQYLNNFLDEFEIEIKNKEKTLYEIMCGENYIFIKDKNNENVYFVCYNLLFLLSVEKIFKFNDERYFEREINLYIKNNGLESYYDERKLDIDLKIQNIIDKEGEIIGEFISIINNKTMINLNKHFFNQNLQS